MYRQRNIFHNNNNNNNNNVAVRMWLFVILFTARTGMASKPVQNTLKTSSNRHVAMVSWSNGGPKGIAVCLSMWNIEVSSAFHLAMG